MRRRTFPASRMSSLRLRVALALLVTALVAVPTAASAHPTDSEPQTLVISAEGTDVTVVWNAVTDELGILSEVIGLGDGGQFLVFENGELDEDASSASPEAKLASAPDAVESYFHDHVIVSAGGDRCEGELKPLGDEVTAGITITYHCERDVSSVSVYADTLMDVDPQYVIAATSASGENRLYRDDAREFSWAFDVTPDESVAGEDDRSGVLLYAAAVALGLLALAGFLWRRRIARTASQ